MRCSIVRSSPGRRARPATASRTASTARAAPCRQRSAPARRRRSARKTRFCVRRVAREPDAGGRARAPIEPRPDASAAPTRRPGRTTPPMNAPLIVNDPMWIVVSVTISCSQRKYQGAFAGLGVTSALAGSSSGERDEHRQDADDRDRAERDDRGTPREVGHRVDGGVRPPRACAPSPPARCRAPRRAACRSWSARLGGHARASHAALAVGAREAAVLPHAPHVVGEQHRRAPRQNTMCRT